MPQEYTFLPFEMLKLRKNFDRVQPLIWLMYFSVFVLLAGILIFQFAPVVLAIGVFLVLICVLYIFLFFKLK